MSIIRTTPENEATGIVADLYADDIDDLGYVPPHTRVMAMNPEAVRAFENLMRAIVSKMDRRRYELVTLAAAGAIGSDACRLAHGRKTLAYLDADELERVALDHHSAGLSDADVAMMDFAVAVSGDSRAMTDADTATLRKHGFTDREIVDIALAAAARNYFSRALHALAVEVDVPPGLSDRLVDALRTAPAGSRDGDS